MCKHARKMSTNMCDRGVTEVSNKGTVLLEFTDTSRSHTLNLRAVSPLQLKKLGKHLSRMAFIHELQLKNKKTGSVEQEESVSLQLSQLEGGGQKDDE